MLLAQVAMAQPAEDGDIIIIVNNHQQQPLSLASVAIFESKDSSLLKTRVTDSTGKVLFENIPAGKYLIRITMVDHITQYAGPLEIACWTMPIFLCPSLCFAPMLPSRK